MNHKMIKLCSNSYLRCLLAVFLNKKSKFLEIFPGIKIVHQNTLFNFMTEFSYGPYHDMAHVSLKYKYT